MKYLLTALVVLLSILSIEAQNSTISGTVVDSLSRESLIGATIIDRVSGKGTVANEYGFFSLTLPRQRVEIEVSYVGYNHKAAPFDLKSDTTLNIALVQSASIDRITVTARRKYSGVMSEQMGAVEIPITQIVSTPVLFGEKDIMKVIQLLPGVQGGAEGSAGIYVRGGSQDENLLLLDGVPIYNVNHMFGFFSVFNSDAVKNVTLFKGSFPARFGSRLSSVIDVRTKDGDLYKWHGNISIGLISAKLNLEGPIVKGRTSFNFSARRTYADLFTAPLIAYMSRQDSGENSHAMAGYGFYDLNLKINHRISDRDRLFVSWYMGDDDIYARYKYSETANSYNGTTDKEYMKLKWGWGNMVGSARWNHVIGKKLFMDSSLTFTRYRHKLRASQQTENTDLKENYSLSANSGIYDYTSKVDFDYSPSPDHAVRAGAAYTYHTFRPDVTSFQSNVSDGENTNFTIGNDRIGASELSLYAEDNITVGRVVKANVGLHYSAFAVDGKWYNSLQPRLSMRLLATESLSFKVGYAMMSQYVHLLSNNSISLPTDLWVPVTGNIAPMRSHQYSAGASLNLWNVADLSIEGYYKQMNNVLEYKDGASLMSTSTDWQQKVAMGRGWSYGVEVLLQRSVGKTTGWIGYTWAKALRQFDREGQQLNGGRPFYAKYDRRHDISITVAHRFSDRIDIGATWVYNTGHCATLALQQFMNTGISELPTVGTHDYVPSRNNYRFEPYHRLDLGVNFNKVKRHGVRTWNISIYNVYNRMNAFVVYPSSEWDQATGSDRQSLAKLTIFPIIPSVSYSYKF